MMARILVINDTQEILELFRMILEGEGHDVILSGFPVQRITDVKEIEPDLIILDLVFDDQKSGWQMLQMLKMDRKTAVIPIIVCTAAIDIVRQQEGYLVSQGIHVVFKPFDIDHLLTNVNQLLGSHEHSSSVVEEDKQKKRRKDEEE
jgi:DNA-binding response OmpR family regulator